MMNCSIPGSNLKVVVKAVQTLSKVGDELHIEAKEEGLTLTAVNTTKTVFATFEFLPVFFSSYSPSFTDSEDLDNACHMNMKAILNLFRSLKEKNVDLFSIYLNQDATKVIFKIKCRNGVLIMHEMHLIDFDSVSVADASSIVDKSEIKSTALDFDKIFNMFPQSDVDTNIDVTPAKFIVKNYNTNTSTSAKIIRTEVKLLAGEFKSYKIATETCLMFPVKPFKALINFAKTFSLDVSMNFDVGGRPVMASVKNPTFKGSFVIASLNPDGGDVSQTVTTACTVKRNNRNNNADVTAEDRQALEAVNWDDDFSEAVKKAAADKNGCVDNTNTKNTNGNVENADNDEASPTTPDSPLIKRQRKIFSRCFEETVDINKMDMGRILAPNSDSENE